MFNNGHIKRSRCKNQNKNDNAKCNVKKIIKIRLQNVKKQNKENVPANTTIRRHDHTEAKIIPLRAELFLL